MRCLLADPRVHLALIAAAFAFGPRVVSRAAASLRGDELPWAAHVRCCNRVNCPACTTIWFLSSDPGGGPG